MNRASATSRAAAASRMLPELHVVVALESPARAYVVADSFEDEQRLILWLARSSVRRRVIDALDMYRRVA